MPTASRSYGSSRAGSIWHHGSSGPPNRHFGDFDSETPRAMRSAPSSEESIRPSESTLRALRGRTKSVVLSNARSAAHRHGPWYTTVSYYYPQYPLITYLHA